VVGLLSSGYRRLKRASGVSRTVGDTLSLVSFFAFCFFPENQRRKCENIPTSCLLSLFGLRFCVGESFSEQYRFTAGKEQKKREYVARWQPRQNPAATRHD
jgi:hypothetical protein